MPADESRVFTAIGELRAEIRTLREEAIKRDNKTTEEQRKVHDIIVAMSESTRNMARDVADMKPHVEAYKMKAEKYDRAVDLADDHEIKEIEKRGAERFRGTLYGLWAAFGAIVIWLLGKGWDAIQSVISAGKPPHPVVIALLLVMSTQALAHDSWISRGGHRNAAGEWCCGEGDCFVIPSKAVTATAQGYRIDWHAVVDGKEATGSEIVPYSESQPSPDGQYWRCKRPDGTRRCFFAPPPAM